jgi:hypothetical protein
LLIFGGEACQEEEENSEDIEEAHFTGIGSSVARTIVEMKIVRSVFLSFLRQLYPALSRTSAESSNVYSGKYLRIFSESQRSFKQRSQYSPLPNCPSIRAHLVDCL